MEDEVLSSTITNEPVSDVVDNTPTSDVVQSDTSSNQVIPPQEGALNENPVTPEQPGMLEAPKTEREQALDYIETQREHSFINKDHGISNWIRNNYNYDPNVAGTMWVAGKINDVSTQMSFLEATLNESLYDEMDLQKYFFDENLATARAYAKQKKFETAYGFYKAAQEKALMEGELTGWYMPAEANYMLGQWTVADEILKDPNASEADKARANSVSSSVSQWFAANNITERGIRCLNMMYYEETVRHNKENERLQEQANEIQARANEIQAQANKDSAAAAGGSYDLQLREWQFNNDQMELQFGADLDNNGVIGFKNSDYVTSGIEFKDFESIFGQYGTVKEWALHDPTQAFTVTNRAYMKEVLGNEYNTCYNAYRKGIQDNSWLKAQYDSGNGYIDGNNIESLTNLSLKKSELSKITKNTGNIKDSTVKLILTGDSTAQLWVFNKDGVGYQIKDSSLKYSDGSTIKDALTKQGLTLDTGGRNFLTYFDESGKRVNMSIGVQNYSTNSQAIGVNGNDSSVYTGLGEKAIETVGKLHTEKGFKVEYGLRNLEGENSPIVMSKTEKGEKVYYSVDKHSGEYKKINNTSKIVNVTYDTNGDSTVTKIDGSKLSGWQNLSINKLEDSKEVLCQSEKIGTIKVDGKEYNIYGYTNNDGPTVYWFGNMSANDKGYGLIDKRYELLDTWLDVQGWLSQAEVSKYVDNLDKIIDAKDNYMNDVILTNEDAKKTSTTSEMVDDLEKKQAKTKSNNVGNIKAAGLNRSTTNTSTNTPRTVSATNTQTQPNQKSEKTSTKSEYKNTKYDDLLGLNGETLFTQEQIEKQNKKLKEDYSFLGKV